MSPEARETALNVALLSAELSAGREDRSPTWSGVSVADDDIRLPVDGRPVGIDELASASSMIELDEQQIWTLYVQFTSMPST